jgi:SAM-dependent methyltransferase
VISDTDLWWDRRYRAEGAIWGEAASPTADIALRYLSNPSRVLEIGFGYGRDLACLLQRGFRVTGIDLSSEARRRAEERLRSQKLKPEALLTGRFEDFALPADSFDAVLSHRVAHLLVAPDSITRFARQAHRVLQPGGLLCLGTRNPHDLDNDGDLVRISDRLYEYVDRPGHRINYCWDDELIRDTFGESFEIRALTHVTEPESHTRPRPCHVTVIVAQKREGAKTD